MAAAHAKILSALSPFFPSDPLFHLFFLESFLFTGESGDCGQYEGYEKIESTISSQSQRHFLVAFEKLFIHNSRLRVILDCINAKASRISRCICLFAMVTVKKVQQMASIASIDGSQRTDIGNLSNIDLTVC